MFKNLTNVQRWTVFTFLFVPLLSSLISTIHIVDFFKIGNFVWMAYVLAVAFEIGSIASAIALTVLDKISKIAVWSIFIILVIFQLLGNIFFSFEFITKMQMDNPEYLNIVSDFLNYFYEFEDPREFKVTLSILIGMPIPLISLAFLKSVIDYIGNILKENNSETQDVPSKKFKIDLDKIDKSDEKLKEIVSKYRTPIDEEIKIPLDVDTTDDIIEDTTEETEDEIQQEIEEETEDVNTFVFNGNEFTEDMGITVGTIESDTQKKTEKLTDDEINEILKKKEYIESEYNNIQKMKKQLEEFYPQVYGKKYN